MALGKPSERDRSSWYFQRWTSYLPAQGETALFNRSWYNRAGVEKVMGFCSDAQYESFLADVGAFEKILIDDGLILLKYYLDISKDEQIARLTVINDILRTIDCGGYSRPVPVHDIDQLQYWGKPDASGTFLAP
mgnify:CR=1 FL=1